MQTTSTLFERELRKIIDEEVARLTNNVFSGLAIVDYGQYQLNIGKIKALNSVYEYMDEVNSKINEVM